MEQQVKSNQDFLRRDRTFVCSMLMVYGLCLCGLIAATIWGMDRRNQRIAASGTSTASASHTQQANATATAVARPTEQAKYAVVDRFEDNHEYWMTETSDDEYMTGAISINGGVYAWNMREVKQSFVYWSNFRKNRPVEDFDMYVDTIIKPADGEVGNFCSGFIFRTTSADLEAGTYAFSVCNDSYFGVEYYEKEEWESLSDWTHNSIIRSDDWNRLEVSARGSQFTFLINNEVVFEMTDERLPKGGLGLLVEVGDTKPVTIWFDNFGFQSR